MSMVEIRPRFKQVVTMAPEEVLARLEFAKEKPETSVRVVMVDHHVTLKIPAEEQHYWSPQLSVTIDAEGENSSLIRGLFGPRPSVWLMFTFFYSVIGAICLFVAITGFAQLSLGIPAPVLWTLPVGAVLALVLYFSAKAGERLGREEMYVLKNFLDEALVTKIQTTYENGTPADTSRT
jgi:hypothetical protein